MGLADPEAALEALHQFEELLLLDNQDWAAKRPHSHVFDLQKMQPLIEQIAARIDPANVGLLAKDDGPWGWHKAHDETLRLIGILEQRDEYHRMFGLVGPTLVANRLHPWVWDAAASLWDDGYFRQAVEDAYNKVERQTQQSVGRLDLSGRRLFSDAFSPKEPTADMPRLRFPHIDKAEQPKRWTSAHEGAMHLGMSCAQGIRNPLAHPTDDTSEITEDEKQEALEQLAALSVLARWVEACEVDRAE